MSSVNTLLNLQSVFYQAMRFKNSDKGKKPDMKASR